MTTQVAVPLMHRTILLATVGSKIHGLNLEGHDDTDLMGVCIEPPEYVIGLKHFEQYTKRDKPEGVRSEAGDIDLVIYSLRKYVSLALKGNPSILLLLHHPRPELCDDFATILRMNYWRFNSKHALRAFLGYLTQQKDRLIGSRGQMNVNRPELVERHGYDTKYAMHMLRLGYQGVEIAKTGRISLPMPVRERELVFGVRKGEYSLNTVLTTAGELAKEIEDYLHSDILPDDSDREWADDFLIECYTKAWSYDR